MTCSIRKKLLDYSGLDVRCFRGIYPLWGPVAEYLDPLTKEFFVFIEVDCLKIAIAGASGFVGRELCKVLGKKHEIYALSRSGGDDALYSAGVHFVRCNLFEFESIQKVMPDADVAIYLVHCMSPTNRLTQASFEDLDFIAGDNFARAAHKANIKKIIYLGGIIPREELSRHLASRYEIETVLSSLGASVLTLRAGLIVGKNGSSFTIVERLVERLPIMICPHWTSTISQPISLKEVCALIDAILDSSDFPVGDYDIGGADVVTYLSLLTLVAEKMHKKRYFIRVPFFSPSLSRKWVCSITGVSKHLVYPLIESLRHNMECRNLDLQMRYALPPQKISQSIEQSLSTSINNNEELSQPYFTLSTKIKVPVVPTVTSIQRINLPNGKSVTWIAGEYFRWVANVFWPILYVDADKNLTRVSLTITGVRRFLPSFALLNFSWDQADSTTRYALKITGGLLCAKPGKHTQGYFEFRLIPNSNQFLVAVINFKPRLWWPLYLCTQAIAHLITMRLFKRHLEKQASRSRRMV